MISDLEEGELDRDTYRAHLYQLVGFSVTGLVALIVLEKSVQQGLRMGIYYFFYGLSPL